MDEPFNPLPTRPFKCRENVKKKELGGSIALCFLTRYQPLPPLVLNVIFLFLDDNYSDVDSKIDVGGDTDDNNSGVHYMDDEGGASLAADSDREEEDPAKGSVGHQKTGDGHQHNNHSSDSGHSQQGNSSKRKKKTRTVFSRSQVIQSTLRLF